MVTRSLEHATRKVGKAATDTVGKAGKAATGAAGKAGKAATGAAGKAGKAATGATGKAGKASTDHLQHSLRNLAGTVADRALSAVSDKVLGTAGRLTEYAEGGGGGLMAALTGVEKLAQGKSPVKAAMSSGMAGVKETAKQKFQDVKEAIGGGKGGGKGGGGKKLKLTNIVEHIDVGVPVQLAYDQWTQFTDFPKFMKKVEQVEQVSDEKLAWTGKVFWSRRTWHSTIIEQVPCERIVWRSKGDKGYIDGAVSFHELAPDLTRIIVVLEYHPKGLFEKTGNIWRAVGRRARLELKHFERHVMMESVLHPDQIEGWHGEIHRSRTVKDDETARREEENETRQEEPEQEEPEHTRDEEEPEEAAQRPRRRRRSAEPEDEESSEEPQKKTPPKRRADSRRSGTRATRRTSDKQGART